MVTIVSDSIFQAVGQRGLDKMFPVIRPDAGRLDEEGYPEFGVISLHPTYQAAREASEALDAQGITDSLPWETFRHWMDKFHSEGCTIHFA